MDGGPLSSDGLVVGEVSCSRCGYDLRAQSLEGACPECGAPVRDSVGVLKHVDQSGQVAGVSCRKCGYDLRTQPLDGACPECGISVRDSLQGFFLQYAPRKWLRKVTIGLELILGVVIVLFLVGLANGLSPVRLGDASVVGALNLVGWIAIAVGIWLFATPEPEAVVPSRWAKIVRGSIVGIVVPLAMVLVVGPLLVQSPAVTFMILFILLGLGVQVAGLACVFAVFGRLRELVQRIPSHGLSLYASIVQRGMAIVGCLFLLSMLFMVPMFLSFTSTMGPPTSQAATQAFGNRIAMPFGLTFGMGALGCLSVFMACGMFILMIAGFILLIMTRQALRGVLRTAPDAG